ncbi:hypothetical protein H6G33_37935 [Calothrix sp. FACHB-1219]|nr:hypothetical protein [Calothrix sp. FACHB-1219]
MVIPKGQTLDRANADLATQGLVTNAGLVTTFSRWELSELSLTDIVASLKESGMAVNNGDLKGAEQMLNAQAVSLNSIFAELARRCALNLGEHMDAMERYMRLALKAQGQCRATLETLAAIKNPPVVFARQANISNGPQQVNNGLLADSRSNTRAPAQACGEIENPQTKLLEGTQHGGPDLDRGAAGAAARGHQTLETVGAVHRPEQRRRKSPG